MSGHAGQATRRVFLLIRRLLSVVLALLVVVLCGFGALAWVLSQGPVEVPWLVRRLEATVNASGEQGGGPTQWSIGRAKLAWEGFSAGTDRPVDIRVEDVVATAPDGKVLARIPQAHVALSMTELLRLRLVPRTIELRGARLVAVRGADGRVRVDLGEPAAAAADTVPETPLELADLLGAILRPADAEGVAAVLGQLRHLLIRDAGLVVVDEVLGIRWNAASVLVDLRRDASGVAGEIALELSLGSQRARLSGQIVLRDQLDFLAVKLAMTEINPGRLAREEPLFAAAAPVDAPLALSTNARFDRALRLRGGEVVARLGPGQVAVARGMLPIAGAEITARGDREALSLSALRIDVQPPGRPLTRATGAGSLTRDGTENRINLAVAVDRAEIADLPVLWPDGIGGRGAKPWLVENITAGVMTDLRLTLALRTAADFSAPRLVGIAGGGDARDLTVHWLRPVPPVEQGVARLEFVSPDVLDINMISGRQAGVTVTGGLMRIFGLSEKDQVADIAVDAAGPLADVFAVLRHPRVRLLDRRPIELRDPAGQVRGRLDIAKMPLESWLTIDDVQLRVAARLTGTHLGGVAAGRDLDQGALDLTASNDALKVIGTGQIAGIAAKLQVDMDFRPGNAAQIVQTVTVSGTPEAAQLAALGIELGGVVEGASPVSALWRTRRDGRGDVAVKADLTAAKLGVARLNFAKPAGKPATAEMRVVVDRERITAIEKLTLRGDGIDAEATIAFVDGRPAQAQIARLVLGKDTNLRGELRYPPRPGGAWQISLNGASIDASAEFGRRDPATPKPAETRGPPYVLDARLDRVNLGGGRVLSQVALHADNDGLINRQLRLTGRPAGGAPFDIAIVTTPTGRVLTGSAGDAGGLLHALDVVEDMQGGTMKISGRYDDTKPGHPLAGTAEILDFRMTKAPALAKLLQAMTLYGLVEMVRGPGLGFVRLDGPFRMTDDIIDLEDVRAFNASLGMTVRGRVDLARQRCDITGTIVPAYFFNSLLGDIPLIGKLFSPERGGGLFSATYSLRGDCNDPAVLVNPLAALTPGFLRGIFGLFDGPANTGAPPPTPTPTPAPKPEQGGR